LRKLLGLGRLKTQERRRVRTRGFNFGKEATAAFGVVRRYHFILVCGIKASGAMLWNVAKAYVRPTLDG
jgi:hypothetical protein